MIHTYIRSVSNRGAVVTRSMVVATAKALVTHYSDIVGKTDLDRRMNELYQKERNNNKIGNARWLAQGSLTSLLSSNCRSQSNY